jgi:hypothetical protein
VPDVIVEAIECLAAVPMRDGKDMCLLRRNGATISTNLDPLSYGRLMRGKWYRVRFEEVPCPAVRKIR